MDQQGVSLERRNRWRRWGCVPLVVGVIFCADFREDELQCEEAVAHVADCCPDMDLTTVRCSEVLGCDSKEQPELQLSVSKCVQKASCARIEESGVCDQLWGALGELGCTP